jgi:hypothetical protein
MVTDSTKIIHCYPEKSRPFAFPSDQHIDMQNIMVKYNMHKATLCYQEKSRPFVLPTKEASRHHTKKGTTISENQ